MQAGNFTPYKLSVGPKSDIMQKNYQTSAQNSCLLCTLHDGLESRPKHSSRLIPFFTYDFWGSWFLYGVQCLISNYLRQTQIAFTQLQKNSWMPLEEYQPRHLNQFKIRCHYASKQRRIQRKKPTKMPFTARFIHVSFQKRLSLLKLPLTKVIKSLLNMIPTSHCPELKNSS